MRRVAGALILALCLVGCSDFSNVPEAAKAAPPPRVVDPPTLTRSQKLGLYSNLEDTDKGELFVGDTVSTVENLFPTPNRAALFQQLPPGFGQPYSAYGYTGLDGVSFGVIYYDGKAALAMETFEQETEEQITGGDGIETTYAKQFGIPTNELPGSKTHYWFWEDSEAKQRFMICAVQSGKDKSKFDVTTAVGDDEPMDALRMDSKDATKDRLQMDSPLPPSSAPRNSRSDSQPASVNNSLAPY